MKFIYVSMLSFFLGGCGAGYHLTSNEYLLTRDWAAPPKFNSPAKLYCYRTMGQIDCYETPQPGREDLLMGSYQGKEIEKLPLIARDNKVIVHPQKPGKCVKNRFYLGE